MSDPDYLFYGLLDLGKIAWAARKREMKRTPTIWMVDQEISKFAKSVLLEPEVAEIYIPFFNMDLVKYSIEPEFHTELALRFRDVFDVHIEDALLDGTLMPHDRACAIGKFTPKEMSQKLFGAKKAVSADAASAGGGEQEESGKKVVRRNSMPVLPTTVKIGDYMKATKITTFRGGQKYLMHVVTGITEVTQALAEPIKHLSEGLRVSLELCIDGKKAAAQANLKKVKVDWAAALKVERGRVREHIIRDGTMAKHAADVDDDGFKPLVPTTQLYGVTPKVRSRERRASVEEFLPPTASGSQASGVSSGKTRAEINHGSEARQEALALREHRLLAERHHAQATNIQEADLMHLYTPEMVAGKHEGQLGIVRGDLAKETQESVSEAAKSDRTDWDANPAGDDHVSHAEAMLLFNKKSHLHEAVGGK